MAGRLDSCRLRDIGGSCCLLPIAAAVGLAATTLSESVSGYHTGAIDGVPASDMCRKTGPVDHFPPRYLIHQGDPCEIVGREAVYRPFGVDGQ